MGLVEEELKFVNPTLGSQRKYEIITKLSVVQPIRISSALAVFTFPSFNQLLLFKVIGTYFWDVKLGLSLPRQILLYVVILPFYRPFQKVSGMLVAGTLLPAGCFRLFHYLYEPVTPAFLQFLPSICCTIKELPKKKFKFQWNIQ